MGQVLFPVHLWVRVVRCDIIFYCLDIGFDTVVDLSRGPLVIFGVGKSLIGFWFAVSKVCSKYYSSEVIIAVIIEIFLVIMSRVRDIIQIFVK